MSRKNWSEYRRQEEIAKIADKIERLERKLEHLQNVNWREPYSK